MDESVNYIVYDSHTGIIVRTGIVPRSILHLQADLEHYAVMEGTANDITEYVLDGQVVLKPRLSLVVEGNKVSNIPIGSDVYIDFIYQGQCESGTLEIEKEDDSSYRVRIECDPYVAEEFTL